MQFHVKGTADFSQLKAQYRALQAQVNGLNSAMAETALIPSGGSPQGMAQVARATNAATSAYNNALASSGAFRVEQIKINDAVVKNTDLLSRQKLGFNKVFGKGSRDMVRAMYREQLALQNAQVRMTTGDVGDGKSLKATMAIPTNVHESWDTLNNRVGMFRTQLASASAELLNWGKNTQWAGRQLMAGITFPVAAFGAASAAAFYQVDKAQAAITKVYDFSAEAQKDAGVREKEVGKLREDSLNNARQAAKDYGAEIMSTLEVQQELAATGLSGSKLFSTTNEVQRISRLGDIDPKQTTEMIVALQTAFRDTIKDGDDLSKTLNFMNAASNATSLSLQDIAEATPRAASSLSSLGVSAEEMTVLLVSMRENGVNAAEGANALKSATTRILNPVAKATAFYDKYGISLEKISEQSGGNLFQFLQGLSQEQEKIQGPTEKATKYLRAQGIAALFGTYQYNRLNASLVNIGDAMNGTADGANQTRKAWDLMGLSATDLDKRADASLKDVTDTASGRFKAAIEMMRAELADIGKPFLEVGSMILTLATKILAFVNSLPEWAKKGMVLGLMLAAIAGPAIMLVGLFANLAANAGKMGAWMLKAVTSFEFMTKAQWANKAATTLANKAFQTQISETEILTGQMNALTLATRAQARAMVEMVNLQGGEMELPAYMDDELIAAQSAAATPNTQVANKKTNYSQVGPGSNTFFATKALDDMTNKNGRYYDKGGSNSFLSQYDAAHKANAKLSEEMVRREDDLNKKRQAGVGLTRMVGDNMHGAAVASAGMLASMVLMTGAAGETGQTIGNFLMLASIGIPALKGLKAGASSLGGIMKDKVNAQMTLLRKGTEGSAVGMAKTAGFGKTLGAGIKGSLVGLNAMMGPIGWITLGITAAAGGLMLWSNHMKKIKEEQIAAQEALNDSTEKWAENSGKVVKEFRRIQQASVLPGEAGSDSTFYQRMQAYKEGEAGETTDAYKDLSSGDQAAFMTNKFIDLQNRVGLSAEEAAQEIQAMYVAAGDSYTDAGAKAQALVDDIGAISDEDLSLQVDAQIDLLNDDNEETLRDSARNLANVWGNAFEQAKTPEAARDLISQLTDITDRGWNEVYDKMLTNGKEKVQELGIESMAGLRDAFSSGKLDVSDVFGVGEGGASDGMALLQRNLGIEASILRQVATTQMLGDNYTSIAAMMDDIAVASKAFTLEQAKTAVMELQEASANNNDNIFKTGTYADRFAESMNSGAKAAMLADANTILMNQGLGKAETLADAMEMLNGKNADQIARAAGNAGELGNQMRIAKGQSGVIDIKINDDQVKGVLQSGMAGVQNDMVTMITDDFDSQMDAALEANTSHWDTALENLQAAQEKASDAMENRHDKEQKAFENRWERRTDAVEKAFDRRIEANQKAIEAEEKAEEIRKSIFEAEQSRLDRLTESANRTIDFNMALQTGDLDEAAKIRNDMDAQAQEWALSDGAAAGAKGSQARIDRMNKKGDRIAENKDAALEALKNREEAEKDSLERRQAREKKHLDKVQKMNTEQLNKQAEASKKAAQRSWEYRKKGLDKEMDTFKSFTPKNMKQLEKWMDQMGISYERFGIQELNPKAKRWGGWFKSSLKDNIQKAGLEIGSSNMWENMGAKSAKGALRGMGFGGIKDFERFIRTGKLPGNFGDLKPEPAARPNTGPSLSVQNSNNKLAGMQTLHTGGIVGSNTSSRKGVARTTKGLHSSEQLVLAQKGERMMDRNTAKEYAPHLDAMSKGIFDPSTGKNGGIMGGASPGMGFAGLIGAVVGKGFLSAAVDSITKKTKPMIASAQAAQAASMMGNFLSFGSIAAGEYGGTTYSAEQLQNANTIASVGKSLGASGRDIVIALMTAMQESTLRNLDYGDRDSVGLFQQRDAWGSFADRTNPEKSARMFFLGGAAGQRGLFDFPDRGSMSLAEAAQSVQVSAYPDAYAKWSEEASAIYAALGKAGMSSAGGGFVMGAGGRHRPVNGYGYGSIHDSYTGFPAVDFALPVGNPVYAVADGTITRSEDIKGYEPFRAANGQAQDGYRSYGRVIQLSTSAGEVLYAHLSNRSAVKGQKVKGGSILGRSGDTGKSTGPHLHFGATNGPLAWLKTGGQTLNDGMAMLHRGETVLTKPLTDDLNRTVQAFGQAAKNQMSGRSAVTNNTEVNNNGVLGGYSPRTKAPGQMRRVVDFAKAQVGKPYVWGAVGPNGYDCSGLQSALINFIKGKSPYSRLFATANMSSVLPGLGFKPGRGGANDYTVGWDAGSHTSGRLGNYGIESTGNAVRGDGAARAPETFRAVAHLPLSRNPKGGVGAGRPNSTETGNGKSTVKPKKVVIPWTKEDDVNSSPETWGDETLAVDPTVDTGYWTYTSQMAQEGMAAGAAAAQQAKEAADQNLAVKGAMRLRTGTWNVKYNSSNKATQSSLAKLMPRADILSLTEMAGGKKGIVPWMQQKGWGYYAPEKGLHNEAGLAWNKDALKFLQGGVINTNPIHNGHHGWDVEKAATYGLFRDLKTNAEFWQISAHTAGLAQRGNPAVMQIMQEQYKNIANLVQRLNKTGKPVVLAGDLNTNTEKFKYKFPFENLVNHKTGQLDRVLASKALKLNGMNHVKGLGTDHNALLSNFSLPSHKNGAENVKWDNTLVNLHKKESVLTSEQSDKFRNLANNIDNVATEAGSVYTINVNVPNTDASPDDIANKVLHTLERREARRPQRRVS